jgi:N-6 DNA Methylase
LPIEALRQEDRYLLDPCCGSGSFLLAGFDRLTGALDAQWSSAQRHQYLRTRISGSDQDPFAVELAALSLIINDADNRNGWKLRKRDVLELTVNDLDRRPTIVVTNPPFKEIKHAGTRRELAAEILMKLIELTASNGFLGVVLPQSFLDSRAAAEARRAVLSMCQLLEIATLPGGIFYSDAETALLVLQKRGRSSVLVTSSVATVRELRSRDLPEFSLLSRFSTTYAADPELWKIDPDATFVLSPVPEVWARLEQSLPALVTVATVNTGIRLKQSDTSSVSAKKRPGDVLFVDRLQEVLRPFVLLTTAQLRPYKWLRYGDQLDRKRDPEIFRLPKVLINSNRNPGTSWRLVAAMAPADVYFSHNFHGVVPTDRSISLEQITAVLNSPVANAWFDCHCRKRWVVVSILERLPFPRFDSVSARKVDDLVRRIERDLVLKLRRKEEGLFFDGLFEDADASQLLLELDELVYDGYGLSSEERRNIGRFMASDKRPGL